MTTYVRKGPKTGRNDPCPCKSGKKYKHCCLKKKEKVQAEGPPKVFCPDCGGPLKYGDGDETPGVYCEACGIGWNDLDALIEYMSTQAAEAAAKAEADAKAFASKYSVLSIIALAKPLPRRR